MIGARFFCVYHALFSMNVWIFAVLLQNLAITFIENGIYSSGGNRGFVFNHHCKNRLKFTLFVT